MGGYFRYDDRGSDFLESKAVLRLTSACNCWNLDLGVRETTNPDRAEALMNFTFFGLGDIAQGFSFGDLRR